VGTAIVKVSQVLRELSKIGTLRLPGLMAPMLKPLPNLSMGALARARAASDGARALSTDLTVLLGLFVFAIIWLYQIEGSSLIAPKDNLEQLTWVHSLEWGYYKHPPLPTWLLSIAEAFLGHSERTTYVVGALMTLGGFFLFWRLLRRLRGDHHATLALIALLCITYYNQRLHFYNHEVALIPFFAASALFTWLAFSERRLQWWLALGLCLGFGALAKYQMILAAMSVVSFWLASGAWRDRIHVLGLVLAACLSLLIVAPHGAWLALNDFGPLHYASQSSLGASLGLGARLANILHWVVDQILNRALFAWLLLGILCLAPGLRALRKIPAGAAPDTAPAGSRALLLSFGLTPLALTCAIGLFTGASLQLHWGTPFMFLLVPAAMEARCLRSRLARLPLPTALQCFVAMQLVLLLISQLTSARSELQLNRKHWRNFDAQALSEAIAEPAREALGGDIRLISGPTAEAKALALRLPEQPLVLIDGRRDISPWVSQQLIDACGMVQLRLSDVPLADHQPVGDGFPQLYWRVHLPAMASGVCMAV
jgi:4-amino-4-deoxy-L-arabinose transferase-like glycosyltransferase